ncbi:hypothetical protein SELMODRAFT_110005 [Selaginella moellendorffii]|uniref:Transcription factor Pur-alpha 1 n=1 Tax=Selaginella moellendorffii TaxID=88036 RepID=D8S6C9_SELML|nr:hypothetical protein SELMODRAFT_110005 [Selaginella moellendorffii]
MDGVTGGDVELMSKSLQVEHKLFYFDLKENPRGRYLKISEKTTTSRSTIIVPESGIVWFLDLFNLYSNGDDKFESKELQMDTKVFYFDVGENPRGRFLKISEVSAASVRSTIIVPSGNDADEGWVQFRHVLAEIHEASQMLLSSIENRQVSSQVLLKFQKSSPINAGFYDGPVRNGPTVAPPSSDTSRMSSTARVLRAEQKKFFFDLGSNARGQYLRISEVIGGDRSAIILPASALEQFHETVGEFVELLKAQEQQVSSAVLADPGYTK